MVLDSQSQPRVLDPSKASDTVSIQFTSLIFNSLVTYAENSVQLVPSLASSWRASDGGRTWTFQLRHGVTFSNGAPLTAQDVVATFTRLCEASTAAPYAGAFEDIVGGPQVFAGKAKTLSGIRAVGRYEVVMHLIAPERYWLNVVALPSAAILDPTTFATLGTHPVGTGPFVLKHYSPTSEYVFVRNPHYYQAGLPYLNSVVIRIGASPTLQVQQFERGQLLALPFYLTGGIPPTQYLALQHSKYLADYLKAPEIAINYLGFDVAIHPFNNLKLRQAFEYAVNRTPIIREAVNGRAIPMTSVLPKGMPGYQPSLNLYPYNPAKGRALLKAAGYPHGLSITYAYPSDPTDQVQAQLLQYDLGAIGVKVTLKPVTFAAFVNALFSHQLGFYALAWFQDYPDPQDFLYNLFDSHGIDHSQFVNAKFDALVARADTSLNQPLRLRLFDQAQRLVMQEAVVIPLFQGEQDTLVSPRVHPDSLGVWLHPVLPAQLQYVWIAK